MIPFFSSLPEFTSIRTREQRTVFLRLVTEDGFALDGNFFRTQRNCHLSFCNIPFLPSSAVHPHATIFHPFLFLQFFHSANNGQEANTVRSVRVTQVTSYIDLVRFHALQEFFHDLDIGFSERILLHTTGFIERQVQEMNAFFRNIQITAG